MVEAPDRVSIALATYNGEDFLREQLASLEAQSQAPDELVIVDDASTDGTPQLLQAFADASTIPVTLVLRDEHLGTWATFEEALSACTGDIILICDQDDRWHRDKVAIMAARMAENPDALMAFSDAFLIDSQGRTIGRSRWRVAGLSPRVARRVAVDALGPLFSHQAVSGCALALRAELLPAMLPFPGDIHPALPVMMYDRWISLVASASAPVVAVPEKLVGYRIHPGQQIGIPALAVRRLAPRLALHGAQFLHPRAEVAGRLDYHVSHLEEIEKRLAVSGLRTEATDARLDAAETHLRFRASLAGRRRSRVRGVAHEVRQANGYRRFSLGVASALADVAR